MNFDLNGPGKKGQLFGVPSSPDNASIELISAPWDVTASYNDGTSKGPQAILDASSQIDLFVSDIPDAWKLVVNLNTSLCDGLSKENSIYRKLAAEHIQLLEAGEVGSSNTAAINSACERMVEQVRAMADLELQKGKIVGCVGGDHSTPFGLLKALNTHSSGFGILQIDAHCDLRDSYEGFEYSHASIMFNALNLDKVESLVQVGIRDYCEEEDNRINDDQRIYSFFDSHLKSQLFEGKTWVSICDEIISHLPKNVYLSFDIDGLTSEFCPNTGTPVPGGLTFSEAIYLIKRLVVAGKKIIGFDLSEVAPGNQNDWDANVGARILYYITRYVGVSHGLLNFK